MAARKSKIVRVSRDFLEKVASKETWKATGSNDRYINEGTRFLAKKILGDFEKQ